MENDDYYIGWKDISEDSYQDLIRLIGKKNAWFVYEALHQLLNNPAPPKDQV